MSPPWMPFYVADYRADTAHLSTLEHGAYILLIMHYWSTGGLPDEDKRLAIIAGLQAKEWAAMKPTIQAFFQDGWHHKRIDTELAKTADKVTKWKQAGRAGGQAKARNTAGGRQGNAKANTKIPPKQNPTNHNQSQNPGFAGEETRASGALRPPDEAVTKNRHGKEESDTAARAFEQFWQAYPNAIGMATAEKAFAKAARNTGFDEIMAGVYRYAAKTDDRPWCNPATWLGQKRWLDEPPKPLNCNGYSNGKRTVSQAADDILARLRALDDEPPSICDLEGQNVTRLLPPQRCARPG